MELPPKRDDQIFDQAGRIDPESGSRLDEVNGANVLLAEQSHGHALWLCHMFGACAPGTMARVRDPEADRNMRRPLRLIDMIEKPVRVTEREAEAVLDVFLHE